MVQTVNLSRLHLAIFATLAGVDKLRADRLCQRVQDNLLDQGEEWQTAQDVRTACLELEHLGFVKVNAATANWSLTDAGKSMYAMAKAKARKPDFVDKTRH